MMGEEIALQIFIKESTQNNLLSNSNSHTCLYELLILVQHLWDMKEGHDVY